MEPRKGRQIRNRRINEKFLKKCLHFLSECVIILWLTENREQNPGLAKFGIALEWGSRGRWFESSNSDQICENHLCDSRIFLFPQYWIRTHHNAICRWHIAETSANTGFYNNFAKQNAN